MKISNSEKHKIEEFFYALDTAKKAYDSQSKLETLSDDFGKTDVYTFHPLGIVKPAKVKSVTASLKAPWPGGVSLRDSQATFHEGFPVWLKYVPGISFRTDNRPFKAVMQGFTEKIVQMMKSERLFDSQGGPIILSHDCCCFSISAGFLSGILGGGFNFANETFA